MRGDASVYNGCISAPVPATLAIQESGIGLWAAWCSPIACLACPGDPISPARTAPRPDYTDHPPVPSPILLALPPISPQALRI